MTQHVDVHLHFGSVAINLDGGQGRVSLADIADLINERSNQIMDKLQQISDDLDTIKQQSADYIAARDAIDADLKAQIATLTANDAVTQAGIDAAFTKAEEAKGLLAVPAPAAPAAAEAPAADPPAA